MSALLPRTLYPTLAKCRYLNQASLGLISQPAVDAMRSFLDDVARHGNLHMTDAQEVAFAAALRGRAAKMLCTDASRVALVASASELMGQLPGMLRPRPGSTILAVSTDFPAVTRPWLRYASEHGCAVRFVADEPGVDLTDALLDAVDADTAVVAVSHVQYGTGTQIDVPRLRLATAPLGVRLVVDATQAAGLLRVDAGSWGADAVVASGYKWLGGHGGIALAVMSPELLDESRPPPSPGWFSSSDPFAMDATSMELAPDARRYTQATMSYISMAGLSAAIDVLLRFEDEEKERHSRSLATSLIQGVEKAGWRPHRPLNDAAASPHIIALSHPTLLAGEIVSRLQSEMGIVCSNRAGALRVSLSPYNDVEDIGAIVSALQTYS